MVTGTQVQTYLIPRLLFLLTHLSLKNQRTEMTISWGGVAALERKEIKREEIEPKFISEIVI